MGMTLADATRRIDGWHLGQTSSRYESSGLGAGVISTGRGDKGGVSYGAYQLSSSEGTLQEYLRQSRYGGQFEGLTPATPAFDARWRALAGSDPGFAQDQHDFIGRSHYSVQVQRLAADGLDLSGRGRAVQDCLWSTSVQFRGLTPMIVGQGLVEKYGKAYRLADLTDRQIVEAVQDYKIAHNATLFRSSPALWPGLLRRAESEKSDLVQLADAESIVRKFGPHGRTGPVPVDAALPGLPPTMAAPGHRLHGLFGQSMQALREIERRLGIDEGVHTFNAAGVLARAAATAGLARVDRVELNHAGTLARAVEIHPLRDEAGLNRVSDPVEVARAVATPLEVSSAGQVERAAAPMPSRAPGLAV